VTSQKLGGTRVKPPPALAALIYGDLDKAFAHFGDPQLFGLVLTLESPSPKFRPDS
jgi:hypothetical protein